MPWFTVLALAFGLAMDAFAVAIGVSVAIGHTTRRQVFRLSFHFGLFQALMPILGWGLGRSLEGLIQAWDHWLAFALLAFVGGKAIWGALRHDGEGKEVADPTRGWSLVILSVATSIDALAVGLSFACLGVSVWGPSILIGLVAAAMTLLGFVLGGRLGARFGSRMEIVGGLVLIGIGVKILAEHLQA